LGDGSGGFTLGTRYAVPETSQDGIVLADLDGDGALDVASAGALFGPGSPGAKVNVAYGDGPGGVRAVTTVWGRAAAPTRRAAAPRAARRHVHSGRRAGDVRPRDRDARRRRRVAGDGRLSEVRPARRHRAGKARRADAPLPRRVEGRRHRLSGRGLDLDRGH